MKAGTYRDKPLAGKTLAMVFAKSSTRTRVSFEVGTYQLGGHALFLSSRDIQFGRGEPIADTARVLSRYVDGIMIRTFAQADVEELARFATVPVINGLTDLHHPCQILADVLTMQQHLGSYAGKRVAWIGDGNNMANSWLDAAALLGFELRLACPEGYEPDHDIYERARKLTATLITEEPDEAAEGARRRHHRRVGLDGPGGRGGGAQARLQGLRGGPGADAGRQAGRDLPALPPRASRRGGDGGGDRGAAVQGVRRGGEPPPRPEGTARNPDGMSTMTEPLKRTPFYDLHVAAGAKMVPFAGFEMPVQYAEGITAEHNTVRRGVGLFDVSHMGEFEVTGKDALAFVSYVTSQRSGRARATGRCSTRCFMHETGGDRGRLPGVPAAATR